MISAPPLRVLHVITSARTGGIERLVLQLAAHQRELSARVLILQDGGSFLADFEAQGIDHEVLGLRRGLRYDRKKLARAREIFAQTDIVHFHIFHPLLAREAVAAGARIVFTEHGNFGFGRKTTWKDRTKRVLMRRFLNRYADFVTFNSGFTREVAEDRYGLAGVARGIVYNGLAPVPPEGPADPAVAARLGEFVVGTVCRLAGFKRVDRLIDAMALCPHGDLLVVGGGPLLPSLEARARDAGLDDRACFLGWQRNVAALIDLMDVFVLPSCHEPFGLVVLEALARGKRCLVFADGGGATEIVDPADVVENVEELAQRLDELRREGQDGAAAAQERRERAAQFGLDAMSRRFLEIYAGVV